MPICPDCDGQKQFTGFVCRYGPNGGRGSVETYNCHTCNGVGTITPEHATRIDAGKKLRAERLSRDESLMEAAKRMGIRPSELSAIEHGKVTPTKDAG